MSLKIMSLNVEYSKHLPRIESFIRNYQPDVICLQELCERDIPFYENLLETPSGSLSFVPVKRNGKDNHQLFGLGILARSGQTDVERMNLDNPGVLLRAPYRNKKMREVLLAATVDDGTTAFRIATTHLRFTNYTYVTPVQLNSMAGLIASTEQQVYWHSGLMLTGDLNAPRGSQPSRLITKRYQDAIPESYTTSLDAGLNAYPTEGMLVDCLLHTPNYGLEDVTLHAGVSDHMAITATLSKRS